MKSLSIKTRLVLLVGSLLILFVAVASFAVFRMKASNESLGALYNDRVVSLEVLKSVADAYGNDVVDTAHKVGAGSLTGPAGAARVRAAQEAIAQHWKDYLATDLDEEELPLVKQAAPLMAKADAVTAQLATLLDKGDTEGVRTLAATDLYPAIDPLAEIIEKLALVQLHGAATEYHAAQRSTPPCCGRRWPSAARCWPWRRWSAWAWSRSITGGIAVAVKVAQNRGGGRPRLRHRGRPPRRDRHPAGRAGS